MSDTKLEKFGQDLIQSTRDSVLDDFERDIRGSRIGDANRQFHERLSQLTGNELELVRLSVRRSVDAVLGKFLNMFDDNKQYKLMIRETPDQEIDASLVSDGLGGELYASRGWIARYSKHPVVY
jgi:hypothetical protein